MAITPRAMNIERPAIVANAGQVVLVLQGGGALGAYQAGVYQALHEANIEPDWVIGTSIGAINACLIAGNAREHRMAKLEAFWQGVAEKPLWASLPAWSPFASAMTQWNTIANGIPSFFEPRRLAFAGNTVPLGADNAGYYSVEPLERTLSGLADFERVNGGDMRLTVGAAHVKSSQMHYFDSGKTTLNVKHVLASGALPPAFPAVRIDGELYWDGGILSNTPTEAVFEDYPRRNSLIFAVHLWNPTGPEPETIRDVLNRQKDIQYSSRVAGHIARQQQTHKLRHIINELAALIPDAQRNTEHVREMTAYGCRTRMHVVRLLAPRLDNEDNTRDVDFSAAGIRRRWEAGYAGTKRVLARAAWKGEFDPLDGVVLHEQGSPNLETAA